MQKPCTKLKSYWLTKSKQTLLTHSKVCYLLLTNKTSVQYLQGFNMSKVLIVGHVLRYSFLYTQWQEDPVWEAMPGRAGVPPLCEGREVPTAAPGCTRSRGRQRWVWRINFCNCYLFYIYLYINFCNYYLFYMYSYISNIG